MTGPARCPQAVEEIDAAWLTSALGERYHGTLVSRVAPGQVIHGSATKVRLAIDYEANPSGLPPTMVLKTGFDPVMRALAAELYRNEATFFRLAAPALPLTLLACYFAGTDDADQSAILLEDLDAAGATFGDMERPLHPDQAAAALEQLALLHAAFWGRTDRPEVARLASGTAGQQMVLSMLLSEDNWQRCVDLGRFDDLPALVHDRGRVSGAIWPLLEPDPDRPTALVHGDAHLGNLWFDAAGRPAWLDWQAAGAGRWEADTAYFIVGALDPADRRVHERELLDAYLAALSAGGVDVAPTRDEAWAAYRRRLPYGMLGLLCLPEMQPEGFCRAMGRRFAVALDDHGMP